MCDSDKDCEAMWQMSSMSQAIMRLHFIQSTLWSLAASLDSSLAGWQPSPQVSHLPGFSLILWEPRGRPPASLEAMMTPQETFHQGETGARGKDTRFPFTQWDSWRCIRSRPQRLLGVLSPAARSCHSGINCEYDASLFPASLKLPGINFQNITR